MVQQKRRRMRVFRPKRIMTDSDGRVLGFMHPNGFWVDVRGYVMGRNKVVKPPVVPEREFEEPGKVISGVKLVPDCLLVDENRGILKFTFKRVVVGRSGEEFR